MILPIVSRAGAEVLLELDQDGIDRMRAALDVIDTRIEIEPEDKRLRDLDLGPERSWIVAHRQPWPRPGIIGAMAPALLLRGLQPAPD